ncbi:MAG: hypothetical protein HY785_29380 [Oscillatoriophycideae cyanobacterium NC_groundwater_1537_Pr4_S-0.65um_50_18]|nr:hypothetical protein [Oscillatoriophycideae cyanobacterium NC_groundwater_1537_Pr4_S-0.65um_50_18]
MFLTKAYVSREFRDQMFRFYPAMKGNEAYIKMMEYLLFSSNFDKDHGGLFISQSILHKIEFNKERVIKAGDKTIKSKYNSQQFLERFKAEVDLDFEYTRWDKNYCRHVLSINLKGPLEEMIGDELSNMDKTGKVSFRDGTVWNKNTPGAIRKEIRAELLLADHTKCDEAKEIVDYLNSLDSRLFTKSQERMVDALKKAWEVVQLPTTKEKTLNVNVRGLRAFDTQPQPFYAGSTGGDTVRVFRYGDGLLSLSREIRKQITGAWWSVDLRSAQLSIAAREWNVPVVMEFLRTGESVWKVLFESCELDYDLKNNNPELFESLKNPLKKALYSLMYGMEIADIKKQLSKSLGKGMGAKFFSNFIIEAMAKARHNRMVEIEAANGATTIYGEWLDLDTLSINSILAQLAQATEMYLIYPVYAVAKTTEDFHIVIHLHDGLSINFDSEARRGRWVERINAAVQERADELGVITYLEWEKPVTSQEEAPGVCDAA